jgi:hypothetical protein
MQAASPPLAPFSILIFSICFIVTLVSAQDPTSHSLTASSRLSQPILHPNSSEILTAGTTFVIQWQPLPSFSNVTLELWDRTRWGYSRDFGTPCFPYNNPFCGIIALRTPNSGSFTWAIPKPADGFQRGQRSFLIKMYVDDFHKPEMGNTMPIVSYSEAFAFAPEPGQEVNATASSATIIPVTTSAVGMGATALPTTHGGNSTMNSSFYPTASRSGEPASTHVNKPNDASLSQATASSLDPATITIVLLALMSMLVWV